MQQLIDDFMDWKHGKTSISRNGIRIPGTLPQFLSYLKVPSDKITTDHLTKAFGAIRKNKKYKQNYQRQIINTGKSFSLWLARTNKNINPDEIKEIELPKNQWKTKKAEIC